MAALRRSWVPIVTGLVILFLGTWALVVLSSDAETSTFLWGLPRLDQSPARELAAAVVGGVIVGLVLVPLEYWVDRQSDARRDHDDELAALMVIQVVRALAADAAEEELQDAHELDHGHIAPEFNEIVDVDSGLPFSYGRFHNVTKYWAAKSSIDERWDYWGAGEFLRDEEEDEATRSAGPEEIAASGQMPQDQVIKGVKFSFPAQLARVRARAVHRTPSVSGALLANITDKEKLAKMSEAFETAVPVLIHIGDWHTSFTTIYTQRAVNEVRGNDYNEELLGSQYARYELVFKFLSAYQEMERELLGGATSPRVQALPYPARLSDENSDPLNW